MIGKQANVAAAALAAMERRSSLKVQVALEASSATPLPPLLFGPQNKFPIPSEEFVVAVESKTSSFAFTSSAFAA